MEESKKRINIQPLPPKMKKAIKIVKHDVEEEFPKLKTKAYTYTPTEKQMANLKKAKEAHILKSKQKRKEREEIEKNVVALMDLKKKGILQNPTPNAEVKPSIVENDVNSSVQQIYLTELDSLKKEMNEVKREKSALEDLVMQLKDIIIENKKDLKSGEAKKIKYVNQAGNIGYVPGVMW